MSASAELQSAGSVATYRDIDGWFTTVDKFVFDTILSNQSTPGTLVELGAYMGRSAVVIADHQRAGERFVVVDLFGSDADLGDDREDDANRRENAKSYSQLTRERFEQNFLALHPQLPEVVQGLSSVVVDHVEPDTARFVHIDASHMYDKVAEDITNAARLLLPDGVVVLDDYRAPHSPGVAAATWEAVCQTGLRPVALTDRKFYGTWGDPTAHRETLTRLALEHKRLTAVEQPLRKEALIRIFVPKDIQNAEAKARRDTARAEAKRKADADLAVAIERGVKQRLQAAKGDSAAKDAAKRSAQPPLKRVLNDVTPPVAARWLRRRRNARRSR